MLRAGLDFEPPFGGSRLRHADLRDNDIINSGRGTGARRTSADPAEAASEAAAAAAEDAAARTAAAEDVAARTVAAELGIFSPPDVVCGTAGPAWTRGELEPPQGAMRTPTGHLAASYTPEQQARLGVDEAGADRAAKSRAAWLAEGGLAGVARHPRLQTLLLDRNRAAAWAKRGLTHWSP